MGMNPKADSYSAFGDAFGGRFERTELEQVLRDNEIEHVRTGVPMQVHVCVALHARPAGLHHWAGVRLLRELHRQGRCQSRWLTRRRVEYSCRCLMPWLVLAGFDTFVIEDATSGIADASIASETKLMSAAGVKLIPSGDLPTFAGAALGDAEYKRAEVSRLSGSPMPRLPRLCLCLCAKLGVPLLFADRPAPQRWLLPTNAPCLSSTCRSVSTLAGWVCAVCLCARVCLCLSCVVLWLWLCGVVSSCAQH